MDHILMRPDNTIKIVEAEIKKMSDKLDSWQMKMTMQSELQKKTLAGLIKDLDDLLMKTRFEKN